MFLVFKKIIKAEIAKKTRDTKNLNNSDGCDSVLEKKAKIHGETKNPKNANATGVIKHKMLVMHCIAENLLSFSKITSFSLFIFHLVL